MPSTHGLKKGGTWPIYWPFKATKFDWNVQTLTFSEWNTWSVKALMELMAASFFGATSPATLPKQKPWSWRCTGCMNWYKGWRVRTRMSLEINLLIKNQWQDLISVTCVLIRKRYRQEKKLVVCLCIILSIESWLKSWYIQKYRAIIIWRKCFMSWMTRASILLVCVHQFEIVVASGATVFLSSAAVKKVDCDADGEYKYKQDCHWHHVFNIWPLNWWWFIMCSH